VVRERATRRPAILRSIRTRLALIFFAITFLAVAVIYIIIAPPLTSSLESERIGALEKVAKPWAATFGSLPLGNHSRAWIREAQTRAASASHATGRSAVSVIDVLVVQTGTQGPSGTPYCTTGSNPVSCAYYPSNAPVSLATIIAESAAVSDAPQARALGGLALAAFPVRHSGQSSWRVVVFSQSLDVGGAVSLVRSRILLAAAVALAVALLTGVLVARALTVRLLRLEQTAQRVAVGDFEAHFSDESGDELGRLARALADMQSQLEGLEDARRRFIATASHELRTPIFSLGGFLELIQDEDLDDETRRQFVGQVREQVDRLGKLATQLLDLSRLESGSVELAPAPTDLGVLARAVSGEFVPALAQHESRLELETPDQPVRVICDPERVAQLLRILIDNALIHTSAGTGVVVTVAPPNGEGGASLSVRDHGPGIPQEALGRIFEPFYGSDGARGAGLGLAIAHELTVQMGARLDVVSAPGGTTFTLQLARDDA
jgi:signal transduction histidine kinase